MSGPVGRVLVADDDPRTRDVLRRYLSRAGHEVLEAADGPEALEQCRRERPDVVLLDLMMPGMDGLDVCAAVRRESSVPIIMLTALGSESDRVVGLEQGADDYVVKPFSPREVTLRVQRLLERVAAATAPPPTLRDGDLEIDLLARTVHRSGTALEMTLREFDLLAHLVTHPRRAFTRAELLAQVWQWEFGDEATVTVHVRRLREKVELDPSMPERLQTVRGVGYRWHDTDPAGSRSPHVVRDDAVPD